MAQFSAQLSVTTAAPLRLWQTSTGVSPDPETTKAGSATPQIFQAGTVNDPVPILIENTDGTNPIYVGPVGVTSSTGLKIPAGDSITRNVVGNDSEYAIATGGTVVVAVEVGRQ
jgi:hypothetical protein